MNKYVPQVVGPIVSLCLRGRVGQTTEAYVLQSRGRGAQDPNAESLVSFWDPIP